MTEPTGQNISVYISAESMPRFEAVKEHIGKGNSGTVIHLVDDKFLDISSGETRRDQIKMMREDLDAMCREIVELKAMIQEMRDGYAYDHA